MSDASITFSFSTSLNKGARCSSMVRAFTYSAMGPVIGMIFMVDPLSYFSFQPVLHDGIPKAMVYAYKRTLAANRKE